MSPFTNKELFMMNGGQKHYIGRDGFADVYNATPEEEAEWSRELAEKALEKINSNDDPIALQAAIENLRNQKYYDEIKVLVKALDHATPQKQFSLANELWDLQCSEEDFNLAFDILLQHETSKINDLFNRPSNFKQHLGARYFLMRCLQGEDEFLFQKAHTILYIWAWSGLPQLRENDGLDRLQFYNREKPESIEIIKRLKEILTSDISK